MKIKTALQFIWGCDVILWGHDEYSWGKRSILERVRHSKVTVNMHEVKGWDFSLDVKIQLKVTHAPALTSDLIQSYRDLTGWRHTQINFRPVFIFIDLAQLQFYLACKNSQWVIIDWNTSVILQRVGDKMLKFI